jgi:hypothetical protein
MLCIAFYVVSIESEKGLYTNHRAGYKRKRKENQGGAMLSEVPTRDNAKQIRDMVFEA